jgi:hypothetical protein
MDRIINSLCEILEKEHKDISDLLSLSKHNIVQSSSLGSRAHSYESTFEIISSPIKTSELDNLNEVKKKAIQNAIYLLFPVQDSSPEITEIIFKADSSLSYELEFVQIIDDDVLIDDVSLAMNLLERKPPKFWRDYTKNCRSQLLEDDYRSEFYRMLGMKYQVSSEEESKSGRTDLTLKSTSINRKIFEFKVWNRKDYNGVTTQLLRYLTETEDSGFIIMCNNGKARIIEKKYLSIIESKSYVSGSLKKLKTKHGHEYYEAKYQHNGFIKKIYHFILNMK